MNELDKIISELSDAIQNASDSFNSNIDGIQKSIYDDVALLVKDLDITDGKIANTVKNIKAIGAIKGKIEKIILNPDYIDSVKEYTSAFNAVSKLQDSYFKQLSASEGPTKLLDAVKQQSVEYTVQSLTESGISANVTDGIRDILKRNITVGASYNDLLDQMRNFILTNDTGTGALERYTKQITTDSLQQFSRQYGQVLSNDLDMEWFMYVGSNRKTSREFCILMTKKKWIHRSEFSDIVNGIIDGVKVKINPTTHVWAGGIPGTDENNIEINCGGYSCEHSMYPVSSQIVPGNIRRLFHPALNDLMNKAKESAPQIDEIANRIADKYGAVVTPINFKSANSILRKATSDYGGDITRTKDAVRNTIVAPKEQIENIVRDLLKEKTLQGSSIQYADKNKLGYSGNLLTYNTDNGLIGEIQVNTPKMIYSKETEADARTILGDEIFNEIKASTGLEPGLGHMYYEEWRLIEKSDKLSDVSRVLEIEKLAKEYQANFYD